MQTMHTQMQWRKRRRRTVGAGTDADQAMHTQMHGRKGRRGTVGAGTAVGCRSGDAHTDATEKETQTDNGSVAAQLGATQLTQSDAAM